MATWFGTFWDVYSNLVLSVGTNALLALSIWLTLACGMLSIANAGFMALGAYASALLTVNFGWPFPVVLAAGMAGACSTMANCASSCSPSSRMRRAMAMS